MRLLGLDTIECMYVIEVDTIRFNPYDRYIEIKSVSCERFRISGMDVRQGESYLQELFSTGKLELPERYRIEKV